MPNTEQKKLHELISRHVEKLPPMPNSIDRLLREAANPDRNEENIKAIIKSDPGLCSELLHLAACEVHDRSKAAETLDEAIAQTSLDYLIDLAGTSYLSQTIEQQFSAMERLDEYFRHSREIAATCPILADLIELPKHDRQFYEMAGVLHDMGRLIIGLARNQTGITLMGPDLKQMTTITDYEKNVIGLNHCEVGADICRKWNLSEKLREAVARHHSPILGEDNFSFSGSILFLAHFVAGDDFTGEIIAQIIPESLFERLGLNMELFDQAKQLYREQTNRKYA